MSPDLSNTRRTFLAGTALGALAGLVPGGGAASENRQDSNADPAVTFGCGTVRVDDDGGFEGVRVDYRDGSFVNIPETVPEEFGSPGRVPESVTFTEGEEEKMTIVNDDADDCDPGPLGTTFTSSSVIVRSSEFSHIPCSPTSLMSQVTLDFVDGTSQRKIQYEHRENRWGVATEFRATGEHAGKTIEAIRIRYDENYETHYLRNPDVHEHLLGRRTPQERAVQIVGASEGEVEYEFTVDGPVEPAALTDNVGAGDNDQVTDNGDGTWTVSGFTGNPGYGDAFVVNGEITDFEQTAGDGDYVLKECEWRIVDDQSPDTDMLSVVGAEEGEVEYEFTVDGDVYPVTNAGDKRSAGSNDQVSDDGDGTVTVSGFTGNEGYGDTYAVAGSVESFERTGGDADYRILFKGREVTPDELVGDA